MILMSNAMMGAAGQVGSSEIQLLFEDDFNRADASSLGAGWITNGMSLAYVVESRARLRGNDVFPATYIKTTDTFPTAEAIVQLYNHYDYGPSSYAGPAIYTSSGDFYTVFVRDDLKSIARVVGGTYTQLLSDVTGNFVSPYTIKMHYKGNGELEIYVDDVFVVGVTDPAPIDFGSEMRAGVFIHPSSHTSEGGVIIDNFQVYAR